MNGATPSTSILETRESLIVSRRQRLLGSAYRLFYDDPVLFVRGEGVWLYDPDGHAYLDMYNNVACVGHCHPHVTAALASQAAVLNTHTRYLGETILDYAERLLSRFPAGLDKIMFTCTGSEANDLACRMARHYTGGTGFIVTEFAYHGVTSAISEMSPSLGRGITLGAHVRTVPAPDGFRHGASDPAETFAAHVRAAIADMQRHGIKPAALLVDTVFSSDGIFVEPAGFLKPAAAAIREAGGLFIADEVQAGFGRMGSGMWGFARHGVVPDLVTMGKPMGNGHPIGGLVGRADVVDAFGRDTRYFNTFAGNPVSCAVGMAVLDVIERQDLIAHAKDVGVYLSDHLRRLAERHALIGDVRGAGLFIGVELVTDRETRRPATSESADIVNALRDRRILIAATGRSGNVLKLRPPLVFTRANADLFVSALDEVLSGVAKRDNH